MKNYRMKRKNCDLGNKKNVNIIMIYDIIKYAIEVNKLS